MAPKVTLADWARYMLFLQLERACPCEAQAFSYGKRAASWSARRRPAFATCTLATRPAFLP
jgi:hypothetical protein